MASEMSTDEIRAQIKLGVRTSGVNPRYVIIESNFSSLTGDFDERYVALTGHVGCLNPHMIAAAPELYEALELARRYMKTCLGSSFWDGPNPYPIIDEALAKAKGEANG